MNFNTPILFLVFNRPSCTKQVFESIRAAKPKQLFIAADGSRENVVQDLTNCKAVKDIVSSIDWDCEVKTLFREKNLGCGLAVSSAIAWFFEHVEQGIILEDDCLPSASFFPFCQEMLELYKNDVRINSISGTNSLESWSRENNSYFFSTQSGIWGWATWKRAWNEYDYLVSKWQYPEVVALFKTQFENSMHREVYVSFMEKTFNSKIASTWDYQWVFCRIINSQFGIVPRVNLISNIGFGSEATHTLDSDSKFSNVQAQNLEFPLIHPKTIMVDNEYDHNVIFEYFGNEQSKVTLVDRVIYRLRLLYNKMMLTL
jgi:hypothetical protein